MSFAVIGGSGLYEFDGLEVLDSIQLSTPFGIPSCDIIKGKLNQETVFFLPRHGGSHTIPPHQINYRANIYALKALGVDKILAVNAVGGISKSLSPGDIVLPDQVIDYTYGREHTFSDGVSNEVFAHYVEHIDFTHPLSLSLRESLSKAAELASLSVLERGVYGCTQGPRLESAAEVQRLANDGCSLVGMTLMPEAGLAKELKLDYASICIVANMAAGLSDEPLTIEDIKSVVASGVARIQSLIATTISTYSSQ